MRPKGLEPPRLSALDPKSSAATNYATAAVVKMDCKDTIFFNKITRVELFFKNLFYFGEWQESNYLC